MTEIEQAVEYLAPITEHPTMTGEYCKNLKVAVKALREKAERIKGCVWCNKNNKVYHDGQHFHFFCSYCGKRLEVGHETD
jgi:transcription elongation factor Elf1